eukprot:scpid103395/ scgid22268/ 
MAGPGRLNCALDFRVAPSGLRMLARRGGIAGAVGAVGAEWLGKDRREGMFSGASPAIEWRAGRLTGIGSVVFKSAQESRLGFTGTALEEVLVSFVLGPPPRFAFPVRDGFLEKKDATVWRKERPLDELVGADDDLALLLVLLALLLDASAITSQYCYQHSI